MQYTCPDGTTFYFYMVNEYFYKHYSIFTHTKKVIWAVIGTFLPLLLLSIFNIRLLITLWHSRYVHHQLHRILAHLVNILLSSFIYIYIYRSFLESSVQWEDRISTVCDLAASKKVLKMSRGRRALSQSAREKGGLIPLTLQLGEGGGSFSKRPAGGGEKMVPLIF